jgi:hypothetical protein
MLDLPVKAQPLVEEIVLLCEKYFREIKFSLLENKFPRWKNQFSVREKLKSGIFPLEKNIFPDRKIFSLIEKYFL